MTSIASTPATTATTGASGKAGASGLVDDQMIASNFTTFL